MSRPVAMLLMLALALLLPLSSVRGENSAPPPESLVIDVRSEAEWREGHLENAILIPHDRIEADIAGLTADKGARLFLYCRSGRRSSIAVKSLTRSGYRNLVNLGTMENASRVLGRKIVR